MTFSLKSTSETGVASFSRSFYGFFSAWIPDLVAFLHNLSMLYLSLYLFFDRRYHYLTSPDLFKITFYHFVIFQNLQVARIVAYLCSPQHNQPAVHSMPTGKRRKSAEHKAIFLSIHEWFYLRCPLSFRFEKDCGRVITALGGHMGGCWTPHGPKKSNPPWGTMGTDHRWKKEEPKHFFGGV